MVKFLRLRVSFLTFGVSLVLGVRNSYVWGLDFLRLWVRNSYV